MELTKTLEEYLDGFTFVEYNEIIGAIEDYYRKFYKEDYVFYSDLVLFDEIASEYCEKKGIEFG